MAYVTQFLDIVHGFSLLGITIRFVFVTIVGTVV
jgi:putative Mg2+ transporter-C (MgtC) family protein